MVSFRKCPSYVAPLLESFAKKHQENSLSFTDGFPTCLFRKTSSLHSWYSFQRSFSFPKLVFLHLAIPALYGQLTLERFVQSKRAVLEEIQFLVFLTMASSFASPCATARLNTLAVPIRSRT